MRATLTNHQAPTNLVDRMAADLVRSSATSEREAIRALVGLYPYGDIIALADQALALAATRKARP